MSLEEAVKLLLVSFDSTIKSNLSVGLPIDLQTYRSGTLEAGYHQRSDERDPYYQAISDGWSGALKEAFDRLPVPAKRARQRLRPLAASSSR